MKEAKYRATFESQLAEMGFVLEPEVGEDNTTHYVKLHAPFTLLCQTAEKLRIRMPLKEKEAKLMELPGFLERVFSLPAFLERAVKTPIENDPDIASAPFKVAHINVRLCSLIHVYLISTAISRQRQRGCVLHASTAQSVCVRHHEAPALRPQSPPSTLPCVCLPGRAHRA